MRHGRARFIAGFLALPVLLYAYYVIWPYLQAVGQTLEEFLLRILPEDGSLPTRGGKQG